jgi:hypothetical protein
MKPINFVEGDLFSYIRGRENHVVIPHVVNSEGRFAAGFVVPLARNFPIAKESYEAWHSKEFVDSGAHGSPPFEFGEVLFVDVDEKITVAHMLAQTLGGVRPLYYNHLVRCMERIADYVHGEHCLNCEVICPLFGSNLAGGCFGFIAELIRDIWTGTDVPVTVCYLNTDELDRAFYPFMSPKYDK